MSPDNILDNFVHAFTGIKTNKAMNQQWDSYLEFSWKLGLHCLSKLTNEEKSLLRRDLSTFEAETEIIRYISNYKQITDEIDSLFNRFVKRAKRNPPKNENKAILDVEKGMNLMSNSNYIKAAQSFSKAIENLTMSSQQFGVCLKYRGVCLYNCKKYEDAYKDFSEAIDVTNSKEKVIELMFMKSECLRHLERYEESDECWRMAEREVLHADFLNENSRIQIVQYFKSLRSSKITRIPDEEVTIPTYNNDFISGAPRFIEMCSDDVKGRFLKTSVVIPKGSIVMSETATLSWLSPCYYLHYCNFCFRKITKRFIPCRDCTLVKYCSLVCEDKAWKQYHSVECPFLHLLKYCSFTHLSLRVIIIFGFDTILQTIEESKHSTQQGRNLPYSYKSFYSLIGNREDRTCEQLFAFCIGTIFATKIAENMSLIQRDSPHYFAFTGILLKHTFQTNMNCFAVIDANIRYLQDTRIYVDTGNCVEIGTAIYLGSSMASHSCDCNCHRYTFGNQMIFVANRDIKAGDEITITYCPHYRVVSFKDRQRYLKHYYHFDCTCNACIYCWENVQFAYRCQRCSGALIWSVDSSNYCLNCGFKSTNIVDFIVMSSNANDNVFSAKSILDRNETEDVENYLQNALKVVEQTFYSFVQYETAFVQLCRYYEITKKYDKAYRCYLFLALIAREKEGDDCLEEVSLLIKSVDCLISEIEQLFYFKRPLSLKISKARELFSSCLKRLEVNQRQELAVVSKSFAKNFRLIPKIAYKLKCISKL